MAEKQWIHFLREKKKAVNMKALVVAQDRGGNTGACTAGKPQGSSATDGFCAKTCERQREELGLPGPGRLSEA